MNSLINIVSILKLFISDKLKKLYAIYEKYLYEQYYDIFSFIINIIIMYLCKNFVLCLGLISIDSAYAAIDFIKGNIDKTLSDSQVLATNDKLYQIGTFERYVFYILINIIYSFSSYVVLNSDMFICKYLIGLLLIPKFFNVYMCYYYADVFTRINTEKNELLTKICFEQIANIVIYLEKMYIGGKKTIGKPEIINALRNIDAVKNDAYMFVKNVIITSVLIYLRKNSTVYYKIIKHAYSYGYGMHIQEMTIEKARLLFDNVIVNKQYDELQNPMVIQAMIYLYYNKENNGEFEMYIKKFKYRLVTMLSLWTIASFFTGYICVIIVNIVSISLMFFRKYPLRKKIFLTYYSEIFKNKTGIDLNTYKLFVNFDDRAVISIVLTFIFGYFTDSSMLLSFVNQFSGLLLFNYTVYNSIKIIYTNSKIGMLLSNIHYNKHNIINYLIVSCVCGIYWGIFNEVLYYSVIVLPFLVNSIYAKYMYGIFYLGILNNSSNIINLLLIGYILSLVDNYTNINKLHTIISKIDSVKCIVPNNEIHMVNKETQTKKSQLISKEIQTSCVEKNKESKNSSFESNYLVPTSKFKKQ